MTGVQREVDVDLTEEDAVRRTLRVMLSIASEKMIHDKILSGGFSIGNGHWYKYEGQNAPAEDEANVVDLEMKSMVQKGMTITESELSYMTAIKYFEAGNQLVAAKQLRTRVPIGGTAKVWKVQYEERTYYRLRHFPLLSNSVLIDGKQFSVVAYQHGGMVLVNGETFRDQPAMASSIARQVQWATRAKVTSTADICDMPDSDTARGVFIFAAEARLEAQIQECTMNILKQHTKEGGGLKVVCIAGPTASGKTTFAHKLSLSLRSQGILSSPLTVDHYYLPLDEQPRFKIRKERSDVDYDSIESMDIELVQSHIMKLSEGEEVLTPIYNMKTGYRDPGGHTMLLPRGGDGIPPILIIEGIHALNPEYTSKIAPENKFKIFISPIPALQLDDFNVVKSTDHRLCRRMSRDYLFRGNSASRTLKMWNNVRRGEETWIFPHQNEADYVINSAMEYEMPVLKGRLEGLLRGVTPEGLDATNPQLCPVFAKATLLLHMLDSVPAWQADPVPCASLMREFIGGSAFDVH